MLVNPEYLQPTTRMGTLECPSGGGCPNENKVLKATEATLCMRPLLLSAPSQRVQKKNEARRGRYSPRAAGLKSPRKHRMPRKQTTC